MSPPCRIPPSRRLPCSQAPIDTQRTLVAFVALAALALAACGAGEPVAGELPGVRDLASSAQGLEVESIALYGVDSQVCVSRSCQHHGARTELLVRNLAYRKQVSVRLRLEDGYAKDVDAHYVRSLPGGLEVWAADGVVRGSPSCGAFFVSATVTQAGSTQGTAEQRIEGCGRWASEPVRVQRIPGAFETHGSVLVANLALEKNVSVVYSTDSGASWRKRAATYVPWSNALGFEQWSFRFTPEERQGDIVFAVAFEVDGKTFWDNNFGSNYLVAGPH